MSRYSYSIKLLGFTGFRLLRTDSNLNNFNWVRGGRMVFNLNR